MDIEVFNNKINRVILSAPTAVSQYRKIIITLQSKNESLMYHIEKFSEKQSFHENINIENLEAFVIENFKVNFKQVELICDDYIYSYRAAKKRVLSAKRRNSAEFAIKNSQNREKNYILAENMKIEPLVELSVFTADFKIIKSSFDKYRQINRFIEFIADVTKSYKVGDKINVIDFGCGKSYLTFVSYYYLSEIRKLDVKMTGLDLKEDVINDCNILAKKFKYQNLTFQVGDISQYKKDEDIVDMVITLHACDTATDFALYNAIEWNSKIILSVPCCQHELNKSFKSKNFAMLSDYGIIQERISSLLTDDIRAKLLEREGYKTQLLEFVDFSHTPKNILIRAVKSKNVTDLEKLKITNEIESLQEEFNFSQKLYNLLKNR